MVDVDRHIERACPGLGHPVSVVGGETQEPEHGFLVGAYLVEVAPQPVRGPSRNVPHTPAESLVAVEPGQGSPQQNDRHV